MRGDSSEAFNLGNGTGFSVQQVIESARAIAGLQLQPELRQLAHQPARRHLPRGH
jgi:UDP-glucose 4-epimerase